MTCSNFFFFYRRRDWGVKMVYQLRRVGPGLGARLKRPLRLILLHRRVCKWESLVTFILTRAWSCGSLYVLGLYKVYDL